MPDKRFRRFFEGRAGQGFVEQFLNRAPARLLSDILFETPVRPPHIVALGLIVGLTSAALYSLAGSANYTAAALLLQLRSVLDCLDGELARAKDKGALLRRYERELQRELKKVKAQIRELKKEA